jgi:hypothetical protein
MNGGHATGINTGMPTGGYRRHVWDHGVLARKTLIQETFKTSIGGITVIKPVQVIPSHLIYNNTYYQFGPVNCCGWGGASFGLCGRNKTKQQKTNRC